MDDSKMNTEKKDVLIDELTENIVATATSIVKPVEKEKDIRKLKATIKERLTFEANIALNEAVTLLSPVGVLEEGKERTFERFGKNFRAQHMLMFVSVIILIITGMPLKFPEYGISKFIVIDLFGGLQNSTLVHRVGAVGLIIVGVWHLLYSVLSSKGRRDFLLMIPLPRDIKDFFHTISYYLGKKPSGPKHGRFSFIEKFDYWAVYWGMVVMIGSGIIMWFKEHFPKYLFDIGREAHSDEGLLATLAIVVWHFYNVHFNPEVFPMSWVWWHGQLTEEEMKHHHPIEYAEIIKKESDEIIKEKDSKDKSED